jgi:hypothetical protein
VHAKPSTVSGEYLLATVLIGFGRKSHALVFQTVQASSVLGVDGPGAIFREAACGETWNKGRGGATKVINIRKWLTLVPLHVQRRQFAVVEKQSSRS